MKAGLLVAAALAPMVHGANKINKHTYASNDGKGDFDFVKTYFCSDADIKSANVKCAVDMKASCSGFSVHMVQSFVTDPGDETPDEWFSYMHTLHGDMTTWDQFMHFGTTFHASDLSKHLAKFQSDSVPFMARKTSSGIYSLIVQTPSAKTFEIVSNSAPSGSASLFKTWADSECPASHERDLSKFASLDLPDRSDGSALPTLTAIGINIAATDETAQGINAWLEKYNIGGKKSEVIKDGSCTVASSTYKNADVRYVSNPAGRVGKKTVKQYEEMLMKVHGDKVGLGSGWDKWMDNHWCIGVDHSVSLDSVAKLWHKDGIGYHAHKSKASSLRGVGLRGESIELNGNIDGSYLKHLDGFDFCTASTEKTYSVV